ncbi:MAG: hypothetical protein J6Q57_01220 [Paraprevotella sp.]|nr:hypothetical protein [Paraprevotella sp.]
MTLKKLCFLLALYTFVVSVSAQTSFRDLVEMMHELTHVSSKETSINANMKKRGILSAGKSISHETKFVDRVRQPDLSYDRNTLKKYRIKNVKTGEYLSYTGVKDGLGRPAAVPLTMTATADDTNTVFFFYREGIILGNGYGLCNSVSSTDYSLKDLDTYVWETTGTNAKTFLVENAADGKSLLIYNTVTQGDATINKYWRYNVEDGVVGYGDADEYAYWEFECLLDIPVISDVSIKKDTIWYVVRNASKGKYLHYDAGSRMVNAVMAPDSCSLFYLTGETLGGGVNLYNYAAQTNLETGLRIIETGDNRFFISRSGDISGVDLYKLDIHGNLTIGEFDDSSEWEFERIANFREIFGHQFVNSNVVEFFNVQMEEILQSTKVAFYKYYSTYLGVLYHLLLSLDSSMEIGQAASLARIHSAIEEAFYNGYDPQSHNDIRVYNVGHQDQEGNEIRRNLATNSLLLLANDQSSIHTNVWKIYLVGEGQNKNLVFFNAATQKYIGKPVESGDGTVRLEMTSNQNEAGYWNFSSDATTQVQDLSLLNVQTLIYSMTNPNYYLVLESPDDFTVSCKYFNDNAAAQAAIGTKWELNLSDAVIKETFYGHAVDAVDLFAGILQEDMGLITSTCTQYSSNYPSEDATSSTCHLIDGDVVSVFRTNGLGNDEKRYLQADLGEGNQTGDFCFFLTPDLTSVGIVPKNVTVEGSNSPDGGFVVLKENLSLTMLLENMHYMSPVISTLGNTYRYLRFTVNSTLGADGASDFALSEFYIYPYNMYTEQAKQLSDAFYENDYMGNEILYPAVELVKLKAQYLLDMNINNHSENPGIGQYPTSQYNALSVAVQGVVANDDELVDTLLMTLEDFINSKVDPLLIFESAWEDGYSKGKVLSFEGNNVVIRDKNIWDVRQWASLKTVIGGYKLQPVCVSEEIPYVLNIEQIPGWNALYDSALDAYNVSMNEEGYTMYMGVNEEGYLDAILQPASTVTNKHAAWYLTEVGANVGIEIVDDVEFVEILADFGSTFAVAESYANGYLRGVYIYNEQGGLTKAMFDELYAFMQPYYQMGPVQIVKMYQSGALAPEMVAYVVDAVRALKLHFPNFQPDLSQVGRYYRLRGRSSGNYVLSDVTNEGGLSMSAWTDGDDDVAMKSILYTTSGSTVGAVNVMMFNSGRYLKATNGSVGYDKYPLDDEAYVSQDVFVRNSLAGTDGCYSVALGSEEICLRDAGTAAMTGVASNDTSFDWDIELVQELPVAVSSAMMTSLCVPVELQVPNGVTVYILTGKEIADGAHKHVVGYENCEIGTPVFNLESTNLGIIPAGMPVLIKADEGVYYFPIHYNVSDEDKSDADLQRIAELQALNKLEGTHDARLLSARANVTHHILSKKNGKVGMYKVKMVSAAERGLDYILVSTFLNSAHRAWLPYQSDMAPVGFSLAIGGRGDGLTGIEDVQVKFNGNEVIYDIHGRRVSRMVSPGLYIVDREKVLVK